MTYFNRNLKDYKYSLINKSSFPAVYSRTGELYVHHPDLITYEQSQEQYSTGEMRKTDTVLDLGANIGAFSFRAAKIASKVFAFEPITFNALYQNIKLNKLEGKVIPINEALGNGDVIPIKWFGEEHILKTKTISQILKELYYIHHAKIDFMKCDTEGAEWYIEPRELKDIRRIEMEFHLNNSRANEGIIEEYKQYFDMTPKKPLGKTIWYTGINKYV